MAKLSRFCEFWIRNTIRNVATLVQVFMTNCQESEYEKKGPVNSHAITVATATAKTMGCPDATANHVANCVKFLIMDVSIAAPTAPSERGDNPHNDFPCQFGCPTTTIPHFGG